MQIKIVNKSDNPLPKYETEFSAGMDIRAFLDKPIIVHPNTVVKVPTGIYMEIPAGFEGQLRSRSGIGIQGIVVAQGVGTIDADYRGEVLIPIRNSSYNFFEINNGDRLAQLIIAKVEQPILVEVEELGESARGCGGFGHTGK